MNVAHLLTTHARLTPDIAAIAERSGTRTRHLSFAEIERRSAQAAEMLRASRISPGDAVLVFVPMSIDLYVALIALFRIGAVAMFLDPSAGRDHIARCCEIAPPAAIIAVARAHFLRLVSPSIRKIRCRFVVGIPVPGATRWERLRQQLPNEMIVKRSSNDPALLTFTSGSTGRPKAAVRSHGFLAAQHDVLAKVIELSPGQVDLATLPIFTLANLASGVTSVIPDADLRHPGSVQVRPIVAQMAEHHPTRCVASPAFFSRLLGDPHARQSMTGLHRIDTGGAPVFPGLLNQLKAALPHTQIVAVYGSTEAEPIAELAYDQISAGDLNAMSSGRGLLAGAPVAQIQLKIIEEKWGTPRPAMSKSQFEACWCRPDQAGEIVVAGPHVLPGYLHGDGDAETKIHVHDVVWHRTGDLGYLDERGRLWLLGRAQAKIVDELGVLYPFAVECAASEIPGVRRSALIRHKGRRVLVVEADGQVESGIQTKLAWAKLHAVRAMKRIPLDKRHNAKVDYGRLKKAIERW